MRRTRFDDAPCGPESCQPGVFQARQDLKISVPDDYLIVGGILFATASTPLLQVFEPFIKPGTEYNLLRWRAEDGDPVVVLR